MSLKYILGGFGSGKTSYCFNDIIDKLEQNEDLTLMMIVPEQFTLETEKRLVNHSKQKSFTRVRIISFERLAFHVFSKTGKTDKKILEDDGKNMLIRKIVANHKDELVFFKKSIDKKGYLDNLSDAITEFFNYLVTLENLEDLIEKSILEDNESLTLKLKDLYIIFKYYKEYLKEKYISTDESLDVLSNNLQKLEQINNTIFWLDGFTGFTNQEYNVIEKIICLAKDVNVTMVVKKNSIFFENIKIFDPFYETKITINKITNLAKKNNIKILDSIFLKNSLRYDSESAISFIEKNYFSYNITPYQKEVKNIMIFKTFNVYEEIKETAKKIHLLVRESGFRYREIAVVTDSVSKYQKIMKGIFDDFQIPSFFDIKEDILSHPLTELIRSLVDIVVHNYNYESVFRFLKTDLTTLSREDIDLLENYVLAYGIKNYKWNIKHWKYGFNKNNNFDEININKSKDIFLDLILPFSQDLNPNKKLTIKEFCTRIINTLEKMNVKSKIEFWINDFRDKDRIIFLQHLQIWDKIINIFEKMVDILGDQLISTTEFSKILDAGLSKIDMGLIPPTQDRVTIGDFERTKLPEVKALFILNVNEGIIPKPIEESGLLSDEERKFFIKNGLELKPDSKRKAFYEQFLIYSVLSKPSRFLHLSYSLGTLEGKSLMVSSVINKISSLFKTNLIKSEEDNNILLNNITLPSPTFKEMGKILRDFRNNKEIPDMFLDVYNWFKNNENFKNKLEKLESILFESYKDEKLNQNIIKNLYGNEMITSVSKLEKFVSCPYAYFLSYNLEAEERKIYEVDSIDLGNMFHKVIEEFSKTLQENNLTFRTVTVDQINEIVDLCVSKVAIDIKSEIFLSSERLKYILERVKRISKRSIWALCEHVKSGEFEPLGEEIEFSFDSPLTSIIIETSDNKKITIKGRIDRVDIYDSQDKSYVKIIDYKSGSKKFDLTDIYYGMQLQLLLYLDAFIKNGSKLLKSNLSGKLMQGGVFYFNINDPILNYDGEIITERLEQMILKEFKMSGLVLKNQDIVRAMDTNINGESSIIPVQIKTTDGDFGKKSSIATNKEFENIQNHVTKKIKELGEEIFNGDIKVYPYKKGTRSGCDFCKFSSICQFEIIEKPNKYNIMKKIVNVENAFEE